MTSIPEKMPYSLEDILGCKDIDLESVKKDYQSLLKFEAETNPRKMCGNKVIYEYQFRELLKCKRDSKGYKTIDQWFNDPILKEMTPSSETETTEPYFLALLIFMNVIELITVLSFYLSRLRQNIYTRN